MSGLTTHVLDLVKGVPAAGLRLTLSRIDGAAAGVIGTFVTDHDGRAGPLLHSADVIPAGYEIAFDVGTYFAEPDDRRFLDIVPIRFRIGPSSRHYHVPLLVTPWGYSTYRGS